MFLSVKGKATTSEMKSTGKIVSYLNASGETQFAIAYEADQSSDLVKQKKSFLKLVNMDFTPMLKNGKERSAIKSWEVLTHIGFID